MINPNLTKPRDTVIELDKELVVKSTAYKNLTQDILVITVDKAKLCLIEHQSILKSQRNWVAPLGIFLTLVASLVAADFKNFIGIPYAFWQAIFVLLSIASGVWLIVTLICAFQNRGKGGIEELVRKLKESSPETETVRNSS